eukprot:1363422-Amorphochlora_amoeboformis.AAC.1
MRTKALELVRIHLETKVRVRVRIRVMASDRDCVKYKNPESSHCVVALLRFLGRRCGCVGIPPLMIVANNVMRLEASPYCHP